MWKSLVEICLVTSMWMKKMWKLAGRGTNNVPRISAVHRPKFTKFWENAWDYLRFKTMLSSVNSLSFCTYSSFCCDVILKPRKVGMHCFRPRFRAGTANFGPPFSNLAHLRTRGKVLLSSMRKGGHRKATVWRSCWTFCEQENMDAYIGFVNGAGGAVVIDG